MSMKYPGDHTATYDRATGRGLVGKVLGPDAGGAYHVITKAVYDPAADVTTAETELLLHPERALAAMRDDA